MVSTKIIEGKRFEFAGEFKNKEEAEKLAKSYRWIGYNARLIRTRAYKKEIMSVVSQRKKYTWYIWIRKKGFKV